MINYLQSDDSITVAAPYAVASGGGVKLGHLFGVAQGAAAAGQLVVLVREGVFLLPGVSAETAAAGDLAYWDDAARVITKAPGTGGENLLIGAYLEAKSAGALPATVLIDGVIR